MSGVSYSAPPLHPELNASSPSFNTLQSLVVWTQGVGVPREMVHNTMPDRTLGVWGQACGPDGVIVPNTFPFNPPADGAYANDYMFRGTTGTRCLRWPNGATAKGSGIAKQFAIGLVFQLDGMDTNGNFFPIVGSAAGNLATHGAATGGPWATLQAPPDCLGTYTDEVGNYYLGFLSGLQATGGPIWQTDCAITLGHKYFALLTGCDDNITYLGHSIKQWRQFYLHDLTTNTRKSITGPSVGQTIHLGGGTFTNATQPGWAFNWLSTAVNGDLILFPGKEQLGYLTAGGAAQVKLAFVDNQLWDDSNFAAPIPAAFGSVDPFSYYCGYDASGNPNGAGIYGMLAPPTSYVAGVSAPTLIATANFTEATSPAGFVYLNQSNPNLSGSATPAGCPPGTVWCAPGDCAVTRLTDTQADVSVSRVQGALALTTSFTYYYSLSFGTTLSGFTSYATNSTGTGTFTFPDGRLYYFLVTTSDGTNTYIYPPVMATRQRYPVHNSVWSGHSILTPSGSDPVKDVAFFALGAGFDFCGINLGSDGAGEGDFTWPSGDLMVLLVARLTSEVAALGRPFDSVGLMMEGNGPVDAPTINAISAGLLGATTTRTVDGATVNLTNHVIYWYCPWNFMGHDVAFIASGTALQNSVYPGVANGSTVFVLGSRQMNASVNWLTEIQSGHPSWTYGMVTGASFGLDLLTNVIAPSAAGQSRYRTGGN